MPQRRRLKRVLFRLKRYWARRHFDARARRVLATPALPAGDGAFRLVSMLRSRDLLMYLVAAKSLLSRVGPARVDVLDDGSLTADDRAQIGTHLDGARIHPIAEIDTGACQRGGCWERLCYIVDAVADSYVVQLDADTVTLAALPEVVAAIRANRSFILGDTQVAPMPMAELSAYLEQHGDGHICDEVERHLRHLPDAAARRYVRGSAGFCGFARGSVDRALLEAFHERMAAAVGARFSEWGSEQVASNVMVSADPEAVALRPPSYLNYLGGVVPEQAAFVHFLGTARFSGGAYAAAARRVIAGLSGC